MTEPSNPLRIDPQTDLPLPDPFPDYVVCPYCGELEVEVYCYEATARCHSCGREFRHERPQGCGTFPFCKRGQESKPDK